MPKENTPIAQKMADTLKNNLQRKEEAGTQQPVKPVETPQIDVARLPSFNFSVPGADVSGVSPVKQAKTFPQSFSLPTAPKQVVSTNDRDQTKPSRPQVPGIPVLPKSETQKPDSLDVISSLTKTLNRIKKPWSLS